MVAGDEHAVAERNRLPQGEWRQHCRQGVYDRVSRHQLPAARVVAVDQA